MLGTSTKLLVILVTGALVGSVGAASATTNGWCPESVRPTSPAGPKGPIVASQWHQFLFGGPGSYAIGCQSSCTSFPNIVNTDDPPWTITVGVNGATLRVTDGLDSGDSFTIYDNGSPIGSTPPVAVGHFCSGPNDCFTSPDMSHGEFTLAPGSHSLQIVVDNAPYGSGAAYFEVLENQAPIPTMNDWGATALLLLTAVAGFVAFRRLA